MTNITNEYIVQEELIVFARNQDILTTTERHVTTTSLSFTYASGTPSFNLSNTAVKNIRYVTVGGSTMSVYRDYTPSYNAGTFTLSATPAPGVQVVARYDYGNPDTVYSELPREIVDRMSLPRLKVQVMAENTEEFALGAGSNITDRFISFQVYATTVKKVNTCVTNIRTSVLSNKKNFYSFPFITPKRTSRMGQDISQEPEIFSKSVDCDGRFAVERV